MRRTKGGCTVVVVALGSLALAGCAASPHTPTSDATPALGQPNGTPAAVGQPAPPGTGELGAVSCADADHCWAVGVAGPNDGATAPTVPDTVTVIAASRNGGQTWAAQPLPSSTVPDLTGISCPGITLCMAVGSTGSNPPTGTVLTTRDGGRTWRAVTAPTGALAVASVVCTAATDCTVLVSDGTIFWSAVTTDFGRLWQREGNLPAGLQGARDLSCAEDGTCLVTGDIPTTTGHAQGAIAISTDDGATWAAADVPSGTGLLQVAVCASPLVCLAGGTTSNTVSDVVPAQGALLRSTDGGHTWAASGTDPPVNNIFGIACPQSAKCVMVGTLWVNGTSVGTGAVARSTDAGLTFRQASTAYTPLTLTALACPTPGGCIAVGGDTLARIDLVVHRRAPASPPHRTPFR